MNSIPASLHPEVIAREVGATLARKGRGPSRKALERRQLAAIGIPAYAADLSIRRGKCFRCRSRYSVVRVTFDYTNRRELGSFAHVECAKCGHVWYRTSVPRLGEYQSARLTLILPSEQRRWYARGKWHTEGEDAVVIAEATWSDLMDQSREWRKRHDQYEAAKARAKARKVAADAKAVAEFREALARHDALREAREREEREAAARDALA